MKRILPIGLVLGGAVIAVGMGIGIWIASARPDAGTMPGAAHAQMAMSMQHADEASWRIDTVLPTPEYCTGLSTRFVFRICDGEPLEGRPWPDWTHDTEPAEQACILGLFHQTNAHVYRIRQEQYVGLVPDNERVSAFVSDLCSAVTWADDMTRGDDKPLPDLIHAFYADRAESMVTPKRSY
jgi:hypothetical protein